MSFILEVFHLFIFGKNLIWEQLVNILLISLTFDMSNFDKSGKYKSDLHPSNIELISSTFLVSHFKNFGNICKFSQPSKNDLNVTASLVSRLPIFGQVNKFLQFLNMPSKLVIFCLIFNFISKNFFSILLFIK